MEKENEQHVHTHIDANGNIITHSHSHGPGGHTHTHTQTKAVLNRMSRLIGHMESIKRMIENGRDCTEVLVQLSAVNSAIHGVERIIFKDHLEHCVVDAINSGDEQAIKDLSNAIDRFIK